MDLRGTELVVLSACETGLGDVRTGEGVYGLRRAFQLAGARSVVSTLFKVPDRNARDLMRNFYGALKSGMSELSALHDTQLEAVRRLRARPSNAAHPFFWAGFVLTGVEG
jgi:CHAT domain-containing protein